MAVNQIEIIDVEIPFRSVFRLVMQVTFASILPALVFGALLFAAGIMFAVCNSAALTVLSGK